MEVGVGDDLSKFCLAKGEDVVKVSLQYAQEVFSGAMIDVASAPICPDWNIPGSG